MLKKYALKKILIATLAILVVGLVYIFPSKTETEYQTNYVNVNLSAIYTIDKDNYVSMSNIINEEKTTINKVRFLLDALTIGSLNNKYLPENFYPIIPQNTKILDLQLENGLLKINFSKDLLNIKQEKEEELIESIVYTITSLDEINEIMIYVENTLLDKLPNSQKKLPSILDKNIGINKIFDITNIKDTTKYTIYYLKKENDSYYYVPITKITNSNKEKIEIIINELKTKPITNTNLISFVNSNTELINYSIEDNSFNLVFNKYILTNNKTIISEEVKYAISYSINDTYNIKTTKYSIEDNFIEELTLK